MNSFENIIGYEAVKMELRRICDVIKNNEKYQKLGVKIPKGLLLYGMPGVGKTLMASSFIEECEKKCYTCRKNLPDAEFIKYIKKTFEDAKNNTPSLVFLDDFDKFANEDKDHTNAEEYVTVQSCIDEVKNFDVFVIATANELNLVPKSLLRAGRFDSIIEIKAPRGVDAEKIIEHYLYDKNVVPNLDIKQLARILNGCSCAELETIINQAGIYAGFENKNKIDFGDIIRACIRTVYNAPETIKNGTCEDNEQIAYHEAGHVLISEILNPNSVTIVSIGGHEGSSIGGFTAYYRDESYWQSVKDMKNRVLCLLGGKCATEIKYGIVDAGCSSDIQRAFDVLKRIIIEYAGNGFDKCSSRYNFDLSDTQRYIQERAVNDELDRCYAQVRQIMIENRNKLDKLAEELNKKKLLVSENVKKIIKNETK